MNYSSSPAVTYNFNSNGGSSSFPLMNTNCNNHGTKRRQRENDDEIQMENEYVIDNKKDPQNQNFYKDSNSLYFQNNQSHDFQNYNYNEESQNKMEEDDDNIMVDDNSDEQGVMHNIIKHEIIFKKLSILLVDDSVLVRKMLTNVLKAEGHNVVDAFDGLNCLNKLKEYRSNVGSCFDLVLMDIDMPAMDGIEATRLLRQELQYNQCIIAVSAYCDGEESILMAGANGFIHKPFQLDVLYQKMMIARNFNGQLFEWGK